MHFTYNEICDVSALKQGDLLKKTPALVDVLAKHHPYFSKDQYTNFLVLTQTCDLVLRKGEYKAKYITLAAVRSLKDAIQKQLTGLKSVQLADEGLFYSDAHRNKLLEFLRKLHNNNDPHHFFLKAAPDNDLPVDSCAFLQLSVPIKSQEHYQTCCDSKCLELKEGFRAKLGFLVGDLYSRIGTEDYVPGAETDSAKFDQHLDDILKETVQLVPGKMFTKFETYAKNNLTFAQINKKINGDLLEAKEKRLEGILKLVQKTVPMTAAQQDQLKNSIAHDPVLRNCLEK